MVSLLKHNVSTTIKDRYANIIYSYDFQNKSSSTNELKFEITIDPDAFISEFKANIDGEIFVGQTKEKRNCSTRI